MPREYARIRISLADDEDFEELTADAQWLYTRVLIPEPSLNYAGIADWRPSRLLRKSVDMTMARILSAAAILEQRNFALFDLETEEVLVRTLIRSDELLKNPKMAPTVVRGYTQAASRTLRAAIITEIQRVHKEHPDYSTWTHKDTRDSLSKLLSRPNLETVGYTNQIAVPIGNPDVVPITYPDSVPIGNPDRNPIGVSDRSRSPVPVPVPVPHTLHPSPQSGSLSTEGHQSASSDQPPSLNCSTHPNGTDRPCRACCDARARREDFDRVREQAIVETRSSERRAAAETRALAITSCELCDDDGYDGTAVCDHNPERADVATRGIAAVRAALAKKPEAEEADDA